MAKLVGGTQQWSQMFVTEKGLPMSPFTLIEDLEDDDRLVRSSAYDELVIVTGVRLPFDVVVLGVFKRLKWLWKSWWQEQIKSSGALDATWEDPVLLVVGCCCLIRLDTKVLFSPHLQNPSSSSF